jgi:membrane-bound serine protease (ClpP class)
MPIEIAALCQPASTYGLLICAIVGILHASYVRGAFVVGFAGLAAALLALLAALHHPPSVTGLALFGVGVMLLNAEFLLPTYGCAGAVGIGVVAMGSWLLLEPAGATPPLAAAARMVLALGGTATLLAAIGYTVRRHTLAR